MLWLELGRTALIFLTSAAWKRAPSKGLRRRRASSDTLQSPFSPENYRIHIPLTGPFYSATTVYFYYALDSTVC